jgi:hypothetical protein
VLDARQGYWQERKRAWLAYGLASESGRKENLMGSPDLPEWASNGLDKMAPGTSIFDPVLCELGYRWFAPKGGIVLDPFAGGSVRGVVAAACGLQYIGVDLRQEQVDANRQQWQELEHNWPSAPTPVWHCSDSRLIPQVCGDVQADLVYSCPPYADLEVYSDNPQDLSTLDYPAFVKAYREIIAAACGRLKQDRFAMFIVGDVRDKRGFYQNFPGDTVNAFQDAGCTLYNEAILITQVGSVAMTAIKPFQRYRKLGKTHQNVLIFFKGNPKNIPDVLGECDFAEVASESAE